VLSAPGLANVPVGFTHAFQSPDDLSEYRFEGPTCSFSAHGRLGRAPVRAVVEAAGTSLTIKLEMVGTSDKLVYRGQLAQASCVDPLGEDTGALHAVPGGGRAPGHPQTLFVSLERKKAAPESSLSSRTRLTGRSADRDSPVLELSDTPPYLVRAYDALATPLFLHERGPVDLESAIEEEKGIRLVSYRLPNHELKLAELPRSPRAVRRSTTTRIACKALACDSAVFGFRPRPGVALVIVTDTHWDCAPNCSASREVELWTLTAEGFVFSGALPKTPVPTDPRERERVTSLQWVNVDGGSDLALLVGLHPLPNQTSKLWLFTFDVRRRQFALDGRPFGPSPEIPQGVVQFGIW
jgi:hypothetical protein